MKIVREVIRALSLQEYACARYYLSLLSDDCKRKTIFTELVMECLSQKTYHRFSLEITPQPDEEDLPGRLAEQKEGDAGSP